MIRMRKGLFLLATVFVLAATSVTAQEDMRKSSTGRVFVTVNYLNRGERSPRFEVKMHSQVINLRGYDLAALARLKDERGNIFAGTWAPSIISKSDHYGILAFENVDLYTRKTITLVIRNVGRADERVFTWNLR